MKIMIFYEPIDVDIRPHVPKLAQEVTAVITDGTVALNYSLALNKLEGSIWKLTKIDEASGTLHFDMAEKQGGTQGS